MLEVFSPTLFFTTLTLASIYALVAIGLNLIYGTLRLLNVAHGEVMMAGAYMSYWMFVEWGVGTLASSVVVVLATGLLGWCCYKALFSRMERFPALAARLEANSLLVFFALAVIAQNLGVLVFSADPKSYQYLNQIVQIGGVGVTLNRLFIFAIGVTAIGLVLAFFRKGLNGMAIRAMIQNKDAASLIGINSDRMKAVVFSVGFALAGLAGSLISMIQSFTPFSGFPYTMAAFVVIILGGLGSIMGGVLGALLLAVVEVYGSALTSPAYRSILLYGVFILIIFFRPQGLMGRGRA